MLFDFHDMVTGQQANKDKNPGSHCFFKQGMNKILLDLNTKEMPSSLGSKYFCENFYTVFSFLIQSTA